MVMAPDVCNLNQGGIYTVCNMQYVMARVLVMDPLRRINTDVQVLPAHS